MAEQNLRAVSTLHVPKELKLTRAERMSGFLFFYNEKYPDSASKLIYSLLYQAIFPVARQEAFLKDKDSRKSNSDLLNKLILPTKSVKSVLYKTKDEHGHSGFKFDAFIGEFGGPVDDQITQKNLLETVLSWEALDQYEPITVRDGFIKTTDFLPGLTLNQSTKKHLANCLKGIVVKKGATNTEVYAQFWINQREAEFLTSTKYLAIRPSNLYVLLRLWVASYFGSTANLPASSMSITHIANEVKKVLATNEAVPRSKRDGIVALDGGDLVWIPEVDKSLEYEQALNDFGQRDDGSYSFHQPQEEVDQVRIGFDDNEGEGGRALKKKLPANMPVFTDWTNLKFAYSNTEGMLNVIDLERCVPLQAFHVREFLELSLKTSDKLASFLTYAGNLAFAIGNHNIEPTADELAWGRLRENDAQGSLEDYAKTAIERIVVQKLAGDSILTESDVTCAMFDENSPLVSLRPIGRLLNQALTAIDGNLEAAYRQYSVTTIVSVYARLKLFSKYASQYDKIVVTDNEKRADYINQGIDPNHKVEAVPNIKKDLTFMPHQAKGENLLRKNPQFTVFSVDAGGGKTISILTFILKLLKLGKSHRPLVLCPGHLVSSYVEEAVYVTEGKVNVVPITSYTVRQNGLERIQKMILIAPKNTIFVSDYDFLKRNKESISYGIKPINIYKNVEFLRQFKFDTVACDEAHYLKNDSTRTEAAQRLIAEIPRKLLASGTIVQDTPVDVVAQVAILDPTIFGTREEFMDKYADEIRGNKVMSWKPNAIREIHKRIEQHCVWVDSKRKEWASLLPDPDETFHAVDLSPMQTTAYQSILQETMALIQEAMQKDPGLKKALDDATDENVFESLAAMLKPYLSRLESFIAAPGKDKLGQEMLQGDDLVGPKTKKIIDICHEHLEKKIYGKILIFTNHVAVAEDIYENLPSDLRSRFILYKAAEKVEAGAAFKNNPKFIGMVGVEKSMNTGLNLQHASRLIRPETAWTPGEVEQGNARINRPEMKKDDLRRHEFGGSGIFLDHIVANKTFDITKVSRLIGKMIQKSKFDESSNPAFANLQEVDLLPMTLENIQQMNDFSQELLPYLEAYQDYKKVLYADYKDYREKHKDQLMAIAVPSAGILEGSKLMSRTPYVPGMALYGTDQLGLLRYDEYLRLDAEDNADTDEGNGEDEDVEGNQTQKEKNLEELKALDGLGAHTEFGDGVIVGLGKLRVKVRLNTGEIVRPRKLATFIITRAETNSKDMRNQMLKMAGEIPIDKPVDVPAASLRQPTRKAQREMEREVEEQQPEEKVSVSLYFSVVNDYLAIGCEEVTDPNVVNTLAQFGFKVSPAHYTSLIRQPSNLITLFKAWKEAGFEMSPGLNMRFGMLYKLLKNKSNLKTFGLATKLSLKNFLLREYRTSNVANQIKPYPMVRDNIIHIALPAKNQTGTLGAIRVQSPGIKWVKHGADELLCFCATKDDASKVIKELLANGIELANIADMKKEFRKLRVVKRAADTGDED